MNAPTIAVVDFGVGNLYSVKRACEIAGTTVRVTHDKDEILRAAGVILPGVGAFGDAMENLNRLDLVSVLRDVSASGKPLMGVCLGIQLLMRESFEFGTHKGLGVFDGDVVCFDKPMENGRPLKVPQTCWNKIFKTKNNPEGSRSPLSGIKDGEFMYFVHSYYVRPADESITQTMTRYGQVEFCSSLQRSNVFACQFHPERSGPAGLALYKGFAKMVTESVNRQAN